MKKFLIILFGSLLIISNANSESFMEALMKAYKNNSELNAERENIFVSEEELKISQGNYLPTLTLSGTKTKEDTKKLTNQSGGDASIDDVNPLTKSISISQTLIDFGRGAELSKSKIGLDLAKARLLKKEQDILYKTSEAYTGLILANENLKINTDNVELLSRQVETDQIRLERGQITLSDVSQSESSLAEAQAKLIQAENELLTSKLNYENIIGKLSNPNSLDKNSINDYPLPDSLNTAIELSKKNNPNLKIAELEFNQAQKDKTIAKSDLAPTANLSLEKSYTDDFSATYDEKEKETLKATVTWPFYSGGKNLASLNKSSSLETRSRLILESVSKQNETNVASAWSSYLSSRSLLNSVQAQVRAAEIANEGITAEYNSGAGRTTLEVIQSNSLLLNAQISLANSERNFILSKFNLLKSIGLLHSDYLKIK
ncbi:TolC family outer membrane protein [Candidatus Pelagibacter communis]|uniref:TolC family outer membrane protein n=1 Tax=Pelagibacter ubique TaxID=198252 RepID=UPI00094C38F9|nr:TolC family outer membrane protein [Candidatus Pelagibacter ubique]